MEGTGSNVGCVRYVEVLICGACRRPCQIQRDMLCVSIYVRSLGGRYMIQVNHCHKLQLHGILIFDDWFAR